MITSFSDFLVQLQRLIDQDENTPTDLPIKTLQQIVNMGERRIYREVRSRHNEKAFAVTDVVTSNLFPIPADFEAMSLIHFGNEGLLPTTEDVIRAYATRGLTGPTKYFAQAGGSFTFSPAVTDATIVQGRYFYRLPDLTATTLPSNALMAAEPDLFLYACLCESAPIMQQDARAGLWEAKYAQVLMRINDEHQRAAYSAGRIRRRPSFTVLR